MVSLLAASVVDGQRLKITNGCHTEPLWVAHMAQVSVGPDKQNIKLSPGDSHVFHTPVGLSGTRYWAKMGCNTTGDQCEIGESGGTGQSCNETIGCAPPVDTKFEASFSAGGVDWVDVSLVDGWTLPFKFRMSELCSAGDGNRHASKDVDCSELAFDSCPGAEHVGNASNGPVDLRVLHPSSGAVVGCYAPCGKLTYSNWGNKAAKFGPADPEAREYCCPTPPESPQACRAGPVKDTKFVKAVHHKCPGVYGYSYDDGMGLLVCPNHTQYEMIYHCPAGYRSKDHYHDTHAHKQKHLEHAPHDLKQKHLVHGHRQPKHGEQPSTKVNRTTISGKGKNSTINFADVARMVPIPAAPRVVLPRWSVVAIASTAVLPALALAVKLRGAVNGRARRQGASHEHQHEFDVDEALIETTSAVAV